MKHLLTVLCLCAARICPGQDPVFSPAQIHEDARYLHRALKKHHPNLYLYSTKAETDAFFDALSGRGDTLNRTEAYNAFTRVLDVIQDGHTLFFPGSADLDGYNDHSRFFPFKLYCPGAKLFIECNYSRTDNLEPGLEILDINGVSTDSILKHCLSRLMRDGNNPAYPEWILSNYFYEYYSYFFGHPDTFMIRVRSGNGSLQTLGIAALPKPEIRANRQKRYGNRAKARGLNQTEKDGIVLRFDSLNRAAILTIRDFDSDVLRDVYKQEFTPVLENAFSQINRSGAPVLIVDLRGNQGGNLENGILLLSYLMSGEFRVVEKYYVVSHSESGSEQERNREKRAAGTGSFQPRPDAFKGPVCLLVDGGSFSNSAIVSSAFRHYRRGLIVGTETGGNKNVICGDEKVITLPHTKIQVHIPTRQFVLRDKEKNDGHGVLPDHVVRPAITGMIEGKDEALDFCLKLFRK